MIRWLRIRACSLLAVLFACGPGVRSGTGSGSGSASSEESGAGKASGVGESSGSGESGSPPVECRELPAELVPRWSTIVEPETIAGMFSIAAMPDGGAVLASEASMVVLDASGARSTVQWQNALVPSRVELGSDGLLWVAGRDGDLVVARYDGTGELARGSRPREGDEYVVDILPEPDGGALVLSFGESWRLARIDEDMTFGDAVTIDVASELSWVRLRDDGIVLDTTRDPDGPALTAFDDGGAQLWRTALPMPLFEQSYQLTSQVALGDVGYLHVVQYDYAESPPQASYWLFGTDRDDGTVRFGFTTDGGPIAATPCGGLYRIERYPLPDDPPRLSLVEYDALGQVRSETELVAPPPPAGFYPSEIHGIVVAADGSLLVNSQLYGPSGYADASVWMAKY